MFFGWYVVGGTFVAQLFVVGFFSYAVSLLVAPVQAEFSVGLDEVMRSLSIGTLAGMVAMPLAGMLIDRYSTRWVMAVGALLFAAGLYGIAQVSSITQYAVLFGVSMAIANALAGSQSSTTTISRWFTSSRGRALGVSALGTSFGGIIVPYLLSQWIDAYGWRQALEYMSYAVLLTVFPIVVLTVRGTPAEAGELPEGGEAHQASSAESMGSLSTRQIISMPSYWFIGVPLGLLFCVYSAVLANITPYATGVGVSLDQASQLIMSIAVAGIVGKILFGIAADKMSLKLGLWLAMALVCTGFLILSTEPSFVGMLLATTCLGLAAGGQLPVWGAMMAKAFGLVSYGRAMGLMMPLITLMVLIGFEAIGKLVDMTGSYVFTLQLFAAVIVVAAAILAPLKLSAPAAVS